MGVGDLCESCKRREADEVAAAERQRLRWCRRHHTPKRRYTGARGLDAHYLNPHLPGILVHICLRLEPAYAQVPGFPELNSGVAVATERAFYRTMRAGYAYTRKTRGQRQAHKKA